MRGPHPVDIHIGMRVRERRNELGLSLSKLAAGLGIAYQQVYKYEKAVNRISASQLFRFSKALNVPVTFFFEGLASGTSTMAPAALTTGEYIDPLDTPETTELVAAYQAISDPPMRERVRGFARSLGPSEATAHARRSGTRSRSRPKPSQENQQR